MYRLTVMAEPISFRSGAELPHRKELETELSEGACWRRDERRHRAGDLVGAYQIRLRITEDECIDGGTVEERSEAANNLRVLVGNLLADLDRIVTVFVLSGSRSLLYWIFEAADDGAHLGVVIGHRNG